MDYTLFQYIYQWVGRYPALDGLMIFLAHWLTPIVIIVFAFMGIEQFWRERRLPLYLVALMTGIAGWSMQFFIALVFFFQRPFALLGFNPLISHNPIDSSFPSGHASFLFGMAFYYLLTKYESSPNLRIKKWVGWGFLLIASLVSFARIYAGVHWPLDIVGGMFTGLLAACLMMSMLKLFNATKRHREHKIIRS